jgi:hypothetical protein
MVWYFLVKLKVHLPYTLIVPLKKVAILEKPLNCKSGNLYENVHSSTNSKKPKIPQ